MNFFLIQTFLLSPGGNPKSKITFLSLTACFLSFWFCVFIFTFGCESVFCPICGWGHVFSHHPVHRFLNSGPLGQSQSRDYLAYTWVCSVHTPSGSVVSDSVTPWTVACQVPLSMGFSSQAYWSGLPFPPPGDLPKSGIKSTSPVSPALQAGSLPAEHYSPVVQKMIGNLILWYGSVNIMGTQSWSDERWQTIYSLFDFLVCCFVYVWA